MLIMWVCACRAIQASLEQWRGGVEAEGAAEGAEDEPTDPEERELHMALALSVRQQREDEQRRQDEQRTLDHILQLSLTDK